MQKCGMITNRWYKCIVFIALVSEIHSNMTERSALEVEQEIEEKNKLRQLKDEEEYDYITVPPDGGYGWVVLVVCFVSY